MSEQVMVRGTLVKVDYGKMSKEDWIKKQLNLSELPKYYDTWEEYLLEDMDNYEKFCVIGGDIYKINTEELDSTYINEGKRVSPTEIEFLFSYYNGGSSLSEEISDLMGKLEE